MRLLLLICLLVAAAAAAASASNNTHLDFSFSVCSNDSICSSRFFLDLFAMPYRRLKFNSLLTRYLLDVRLEETFIAEHTGQGRDTGNAFWLALLRRAEFCGVNEYFDDDAGGCRTKPGKVGSHDPPGSLTFPFYSFLLAVTVGCVFILARIEMFSSEARENYQRQAEVSSQIQFFVSSSSRRK
jgi:hypothetical protein